MLIRDGALVIGEPDNSFKGKAEIECWGDKDDKKLPEFGSKFIGVKGGLISMHGKKPSHSWTRLNSTAEKGASSITVKGAVDWEVGSTIVIASTGFDHNESERVTIAGIEYPRGAADDTTFISLNETLMFTHLGEIQT